MLSIKHWHKSAFAETPSKARHSREARRRWASRLVYIYLPPQTTTTQWKLLERKRSICASGWKEKTNSANCNGRHHHRYKECLRQWLKGKRHQCKLQPVAATMCASGVLALVDRRITPQAQGTKVRAQGAKVRTEGAKVNVSTIILL